MRFPRDIDIWLPEYVRSRAGEWVSRPRPSRVWIALCDHYEPLWRGADVAAGQVRVAQWRDLWPQLAQEVGPDSRGALPKHSFFFPQDEYHPSFLDPLAEMVEMGVGDVEIHIHHDGEGRERFIEKMSEFRDTLHHRHGLLRRVEGKLQFGFIHGNWALDNSHPDGLWCGLNDELLVLRDLGCYADFTMPAYRSRSQPRMINRIYWATDDPQKPKSYDWGVPLVPGGKAKGDMLMVPGPLGMRWRERLMPRVEFAEIADNEPVNALRVRRWFDLAPRIGSDVFLKLHTHGTQDKNSNLLLKEKHLVKLYGMARAEAKRQGADCYFVSAWEMYQGIMATVAGSGTTAASDHLPLFVTTAVNSQAKA